MSNLVRHAEVELKLVGMDPDGPEDDFNTHMAQHLIKMVEVFSEEGHSGFRAGYAVKALEKLLRYEPLTPLTGEKGEWGEVADGVLQNKRCSRVFKENGEAYDINGKIFRDPDGTCWSNSESKTPVTFPYTPKTE